MDAISLRQRMPSRATGRGADREAIAITMVALIPTGWVFKQGQSWHVTAVTPLKLTDLTEASPDNRIGFKHDVLRWVSLDMVESKQQPFDRLKGMEPIQPPSNGINQTKSIICCILRKKI